jgi:tetratricopeptide (TPR) repeat protein
MFDEYFSGSLNHQEKEDLESRLEMDLKLDQAFREYKDLRNGIDYSIMKTLKEELQELEVSLPDIELEPETKLILEQVSTPLYRTYWKIAAVVIVIAISAGVLFYQLIPPTSPQALFSQNFEVYPNEFVSAQRGADLSADLKVQAFQAYDAQDYTTAISGFERVLEQEESALVLFYLGSAQLHENKSALAIDTFERFLEISQDMVPEGKWYLALSYLNENRVENARELLEELKENEALGNQAQKILKHLEE